MRSLRFQLGPFPVEIQAGFWIIALILGQQDGWLGMGLWVLVLLVSILIHELGHALAFRRFGHTARITLYTMGGLTHGQGGAALTPPQRVVVSLAGPLAGFLSGLALWALTLLVPVPAAGPVAEVVSLWLWINLGWGMFNLLPIHPLDGSQALAGLLDWAGLPGRIGALWVSVPLTLGLLGLSVWGGAYWIALLSGWALYHAASQLHKHRQHTADQALAPQIDALREHLRAGASPEEALQTGRSLREQARSAEARYSLDVLIAYAALRAGDPLAAAAQLDEMPHTLPLPPELGSMIAHQLHEDGAYARAASLSTQLFREGRGAVHAYNVACSLARDGDEDGAVRWLQEAAEAGWAELEQADTDPDLASIRALPAWAELRRLLTEQAVAG